MSNLNRSSFVLLRKTKRSFITEFLCTSCGHKFRRKLCRIYVDSPTHQKRTIHKLQTPYSEYVIPQRIICPKCQTTDQYELTAYTLSSLSLALHAAVFIGGLAKRHPVRIIEFSLSDKKIIHPLEALKICHERVISNPNKQSVRLQYAKLLAALGYFAEAETEYTTLLDQNPGRLEAWYQLAAVYVGLKRKREAKITLQNLIRQSQQAVVLKKKEEILIQKALEFIYGDLPLDELTPQELDGGA